MPLQGEEPFQEGGRLFIAHGLAALVIVVHQLEARVPMGAHLRRVRLEHRHEQGGLCFVQGQRGEDDRLPLGTQVMAQELDHIVGLLG